MPLLPLTEPVDPMGWAFAPDVRQGLYDVIDARRDIRRFRPDAVPEEVLDRVLTAAHHGPSVGHSQPWRFLVVTDASIRERAAIFADRERMRQADLLEPEAARRLLDLQLEGIREAPLGVVVCCDRRTPATGILGGRHSKMQIFGVVPVLLRICGWPPVAKDWEWGG